MSLSGGSAGSQDEKTHVNAVESEKTPHDPIDTNHDSRAPALDVTKWGAEGQDLQTAYDGKTVLIPQPSSNPNDPLNWSPLKKHVTLLVITVIAGLSDFGGSMGVVTVIPQALQWEKPQNTIQHSLVGNIFCQGAGGLFVVFLSAYFGRLPILFLFVSASLGTSAWCAAATSFSSYFAARILNGFFSVIAQAGGLMFIQDIFFFHEHPRKINIWSAGIVAAPFLGPLITAFIINKKSWPDAFWVNTGLSALCWLLVVGLVDETIYNRSLAPDQQPVPKSRLLRLIGIEQWRSRHLRQSFFHALMRPIVAISKLPVLLCTIYYFLNFAWIIGVNATVSIWLTSIYKFTPYNLGFFYFAPIIGAILGAALGHWLHDFVGNYYMKRHSGHIEPEARLIIIWLASPIMAVSVLILGFALQNTYHYMVIAIFFAGQLVGIMIATVALNAYLLDAYPEGSGEVGAWICFGRNMGGFMAIYIEINWVLKSGPQNALGAQAAISAAAGFIILALGFFGKRLRKAQGKMEFAMESGY